MADEKKYHDINDIMSILPHRFPILLVDRVTEVRENGGKGYKNISAGEDVFNGHFPGAPVYPGVYQVEGMAQCAGYIMLYNMKNEQNLNPEDFIIYFMKIDGVKFRRPVMPGDRLDYEIELIKLKGKIGVFKGVASVDGEKACEAEMTAMIAPRNAEG